MVSVLIPTLNEEALIATTLQRVQKAIPGVEIIVSDGGSSDRTREIAARFGQVINGPCGRGSQLNAAAHAASGDIILFLHADTLLPDENVEPLIEEIFRRPGVSGLNFQVKFEPAGPDSTLLCRLYRVARRCRVFFGDSGIAVRRQEFLDRGGFQRLYLMEDLELARWMRRRGQVALMPHEVVTSARRFRGRLARTVLLWTSLTVLEFLGVDDSFLVQYYSADR